MNPNDQAIAQLLAMSQPQQQKPLMVPPVKSAMPSGGQQPMQDPMQGVAQLAQAGAGAFKNQNMAGQQPGFPQAPLNTSAMGMAPGGVFGMLKNPFATPSMGGGLY